MDLRKLALVNNYFGDNRPKLDNSECNKSSAENAFPTASQGYQGASRSNSGCSEGSHDRRDESIFKDRTSSMASYQSINQKQGSTPASTPRTERTVRFSGRVSKLSCISHNGMSRVCLREAAAEKRVSTFESLTNDSTEKLLASFSSFKSKMKVEDTMTRVVLSAKGMPKLWQACRRNELIL